MNSAFSTEELFDLLIKLDIPVLRPGTDSPYEVSNIISELFKKWKSAEDTAEARHILNALQWISQSVEFNDAQKLMLQIADSETGSLESEEQQKRDEEQRKLEEEKKKKAEAERKRIQRESDKALNEFLAGFRIIGGDAL